MVGQEKVGGRWEMRQARVWFHQGLADEQGVGAGAAAKVRLGGETATRH